MQQRRQQLVFREDRQHAQSTAEGECTDVTHEDERRVGVVPEKADARADDRRAKDAELDRTLDFDDMEI